MSKRTTILGTACVFGMALVAGPAAAATLTSMAGTLTTSFTSTDNSGSGSDTVKSWLLGGSVAGPLSDVMSLNFQVDASYTHNWAHQFSEEDWNLGGSAFWASNDSRIGVNVNYLTATHFAHATNFGVFGEWYFDNITAMAKGGWLSTGGSPFGGHGNYLGGALSFYPMPDLAVTGGVEWNDVVTGRGCGHVCGREDANITAWEIAAEFLFSEEYNVSGYAGFTYSQDKFFNFDSHDNIWHVGLRWYTGGGSLQDKHRNGNLNPWLPSSSARF